LQLDGQSVIAANLSITQGASTSTATLTGSYSLSSNCLGSATLTDSKGGSYVMGFSVYSATKVYSSNVYVTLAQSGKLLISGTAHATYGQPTATMARDRGRSPEACVVAKGCEFVCRRVWA
jgi:hypothetical protein